MYGTVAKLKAKPGSGDALRQMSSERGADRTDDRGYLFHYVYKLDSGNDEYILVVGFKDKESYHANASSPETNKEYEEFRSLLVSDPEWMDGEIVDSGSVETAS